MYIAHVLLFPGLIATLIALHLALIVRHHHTQFRTSPRATERRLLGVPAFPGQTPRSVGLMLAVAALLFLMGGLIQINPIWQWGPYEVANGTNGAQPDWYLGWLIGALRLVPGFDLRIGDYTLAGNPFWGGALFPLIVLFVLLAIPAGERRLTGDGSIHNLADRPRDAPGRTAFGMAFLTWVALIFVAGSADRMYVFIGLSYEAQIWFYRVAVLVLPFVAYVVTKRVCLALQETEQIERERELAEAEARATPAPAPVSPAG
jgi:ubiquinol-cytochrome c reductase cytochrome b subunit